MKENKDTPKKIVLAATGRRKTAIARVRFIPEGKGQIIVNGKNYSDYFPTIDYKIQVTKPLTIVDLVSKVDILANVGGGGLSGQAGAVSLGIARALVEWNPQLRSTLRKEDLLTRDPRSKERKKYGRKGARRRFQWTKR